MVSPKFRYNPQLHSGSSRSALRFFRPDLCDSVSLRCFWSFIMAYDVRFGPSAQTPAQRARVLEQLQATLPSLKTKATAYARQLYARYVAGELTWADVRQALNAA